MKEKPYKLKKQPGFYIRELHHKRNSSWYDENLGICVGWRLYNKGRI